MHGCASLYMSGPVGTLSFSIPAIFLTMMILCYIAGWSQLHDFKWSFSIILMSILCISTKRIPNELGEGGILLVSWAVTVLEPQYPLCSVVHRGGLLRTEMAPFPYCNPAGMPSSSQLTMTMTSKQQMPALGKRLCQWSAIMQTCLHDCRLPSPT